MAIDLSGRVCLVTGAGQGIGLAVARGFAQRGAVVVATDLKPPACDEAAACLAWDVSDVPRAAAVVDEVVQRFGQLDALVANAGIYPRQAWDEVDLEAWRQVLDVNLTGTWAGAQAAAKAMKPRGYGKIVTVTSVETLLGRADHNHYIAAKMGIIGLTRSLARSLGGDGIRVNSIMPGAVRTPTELLIAPDQEAVAQRCRERQCLPDRILPEDIEPSFAFLCAAESDAITGQVLCVDHGLVHW